MDKFQHSEDDPNKKDTLEKIIEDKKALEGGISNAIRLFVEKYEHLGIDIEVDDLSKHYVKDKKSPVITDLKLKIEFK